MFRSASFFIGTSFTVEVFTVFATSNEDSIVGIPHKIYSMQRILIHIKSRSLKCKCAHLHSGYAANLVARSRYYHCHWILSWSMIVATNLVCYVGFHHGLPCHVKNMARGTQKTKNDAEGWGFCHYRDPRPMFFTRHGRPWSNPIIAHSLIDFFPMFYSYKYEF